MKIDVCAVCGEEKDEHEIETLHCPIYASFDRWHLAGFHPGLSFTAKTRRPAFMISTEGKSKEQMKAEAREALRKYMEQPE